MSEEKERSENHQIDLKKLNDDAKNEAASFAKFFMETEDKTFEE